MRNGVMEEGMRLITEAGGEIDDIVDKNHFKVKWTLRGCKHITVFNKTASDGRSLKNDIALVRRQIARTLQMKGVAA